MANVALVSLGCAKNLVDSEMMLSMFRDGFRIVKDLDEADIIILNTCAFIEAARSESLAEIRRLLGYRKAKLVVTGCLGQRYKKKLGKEFPEVARFVSLDEYKDLHSLLREVAGSGSISPIDPLERTYATAPYFAYLRISEGCDHFCAFCAIPFIRGRYVSRPYGEVLAEARKLLSLGKKEIAVISQDPAAYGLDFPNGKPDFCDLIGELDKLGFYRIRLLYLYPSELDSRFIDTVKNSRSIARYFDIPVQSGSQHVLALMHRKDTREGNLKLIRGIRGAMPEATFRTTLIAGFPGETPEDVEDTLSFLREAEIDHVGAFAYSREAGTPAYYSKEQVDEGEKKAREALYMRTATEISLRLNEGRVGSVMEGLVIGRSDSPKGYFLRTDWNAPDDIDGDVLLVTGKEYAEGEPVRVRITRGGAHRLLATDEI